MSAKEQKRLLIHVRDVASDITRCVNNNPAHNWIYVPLSKFPKKGRKPHYTLEEIVADMLEQLMKGNDVPSGMLGRWNRLFNNTDFDIVMEDQLDTQTSTSNIHKFFKID